MKLHNVCKITQGSFLCTMLKNSPHLKNFHSRRDCVTDKYQLWSQRGQVWTHLGIMEFGWKLWIVMPPLNPDWHRVFLFIAQGNDWCVNMARVANRTLSGASVRYPLHQWQGQKHPDCGDTFGLQLNFDWSRFDEGDFYIIIFFYQTVFCLYIFSCWTLQ